VFKSFKRLAYDFNGRQPSRDEATSVTLEWNPKVEKPLVKILSPILKPVFRWNHEWTMKHGQRQIVEYLKNGGGG
jgi:hypothetical protein